MMLLFSDFSYTDVTWLIQTAVPNHVIEITAVEFSTSDGTFEDNEYLTIYDGKFHLERVRIRSGENGNTKYSKQLKSYSRGEDKKTKILMWLYIYK